MLALAALYGHPEQPPPTDAQPEEPRLQLSTAAHSATGSSPQRHAHGAEHERWLPPTGTAHPLERGTGIQHCRRFTIALATFFVEIFSFFFLLVHNGTMHSV